ncbi:hypothetical protein [Phascolarctobacterium sp.]|uniref:hypothetical protein n=1 Tax=Phascolarctobacterium sp. TaxID=2049039 RepID=UPI003869D423
MIEKFRTYGWIILVLLFAIAYAVFSPKLHDNGAGADKVGADIRATAEQQREVTAGIKDAEKSVSGIEDTATVIENTVRTDGELIAEGKSILAGIRQRGKTDTPKD